MRLTNGSGSGVQVGGSSRVVRPPPRGTSVLRLGAAVCSQARNRIFIWPASGAPKVTRAFLPSSSTSGRPCPACGRHRDADLTARTSGAKARRMTSSLNPGNRANPASRASHNRRAVTPSMPHRRCSISAILCTRRASGRLRLSGRRSPAGLGLDGEDGARLPKPEAAAEQACLRGA